jgi:acetolactate synthase-1/2/3 large subunit
MITGARAIVQSLEKNGVKIIFGIPGGANLPFYDELLNSNIRHILVRHEQCAAHMADGFARASGEVGVCSATSGPGAANLVTGITNAFMDSSPIVALTGQVNKPMIGRDAFQEADITGICMPVTKQNYQVTAVKDIPKIFKEAFYIAKSGRPGPVLIDVPLDVQKEKDEVESDGKLHLPGYKPKKEGHPLQIKKAAHMLLNSEKPMILAGGGVIIANACEELGNISEFLVAPVATSLMGKGSFPENHPLSLGMMGMHGRPAANYLVNECDVLLAVGLRFSDRTTAWKLDQFSKSAKIIHVDIDAAEIEKNVKVHVPIVGDAKIILKAILDEMAKTAKKERTLWRKRVEETKATYDPKNEIKKELTAPQVLRLIRKILPNDAIVATEVGQNQMWAAHYFEAYLPRTYITSGGLGTMGFGFPASIGAKVAKPEKIVLDIAGDGSFLMTEQDLATSVSENIPVIVCILNNSVLGMVAQWQRLFYGKRYSAVKLGKIPDFVKLAEAYGAQGVRAESYEKIEKAVKDAMKSEVTTVIDIPINPEENILPMVPPGEAIDKIVFG